MLVWGQSCIVFWALTAWHVQRQVSRLQMSQPEMWWVHRLTHTSTVAQVRSGDVLITNALAYDTQTHTCTIPVQQEVAVVMQEAARKHAALEQKSRLLDQSSAPE